MRCPDCAAENPDGSKFCSSCGNPIKLPDLPPPPVTEEAPGESVNGSPEEGAVPGEEAAGSPDDSTPFGRGVRPPPVKETAGTTFCARCGNAFLVEEMEKMDGDLLCAECFSHRRTRRSETPSPGFGIGMESGGPAFGLAPPLGPPRKVPSTARTKAASTPLSATQMVFFVFIGVLLLVAAAVAAFFFLVEKPAPPPPPAPKPAPKPVEKPKPPVEKVQKPEPPPEEHKPPRDYTPRSFVGVYRGVFTGEGRGLGNMHFVSENGDTIFLKAPAGIHDLYEPGMTYRFVFKPTDEWFDHQIIAYHSLHSPIEEE